MGSSNVPVASYFPTGYHDNPLPIGKYYPSNYEVVNNQQSGGAGVNSASSPSVNATPRSPHMSPSGSVGPCSPGEALDPEARRKLQLQQYQRDMMARASRAATDIAESSSLPSPTLGDRDGSPDNAQFGPHSLVAMSSVNMRFIAPSSHKPNSPRLHPLGSPGPVTPMELEASSAAASGYLDSRGQDMTDRRPIQGLAPPSTSKGLSRPA